MDITNDGGAGGIRTPLRAVSNYVRTASGLWVPMAGSDDGALLTALADGSGNAAPAHNGIVANASFTPAASAYGAGDIFDLSKEFAFKYAESGDAVPAGALIRILTSVMKIDVNAVPSGQTTYTMQIYSEAQPSGQADNDAWTLVSGDLASYRGSIALGAPADLGGCLYVKQSYVDADVKLETASAFGRLVTDAAFTPSAVARQVFFYGVLL